MSDAAAPAGGRYGRFEILVAERRLLVDGVAVTLGSRAFDLLAALSARRERVVAKDELMDVVWPGMVVEDNNLQVQISALRKVLGPQAIATVPGRGYQFTVALASAATASGEPSVRAARPAAATASDSASARPRAHPSAATLRPARVLVADDNKVNRLLLCRSLELMGHEVDCADNGRVALEKLRGAPFDLLLLDLEMPEVDGFALLEQRATDGVLGEVPVIVTSSLEGAANVARVIELGADDFLHKPVNPMLLRARVDSSLERKRLRDRQRELVARMAPGLENDAPAAGRSAAQRVTVTLLAAQFGGVDALGAAQPAAETLELLCSWTTLMVDAVESHGGVVSQIAGDRIGAIFGAPEPVRGEGGAPWAGAQAALEMIALARLFDAERTAAGQAPLGLGLGLAGGEVVAGYAGTPRRVAYVGVGAPVQRAARLAESAAAEGVAAWVDTATQAALAGLALPAPGQGPMLTAVRGGAGEDVAYALRPPA